MDGDRSAGDGETRAEHAKLMASIEEKMLAGLGTRS